MNDDVIYRQAAIDRFEPWLKVKGYNEGELNMLKAVLYELKCLPSAQTERKTGRWIDTEPNISDASYKKSGMAYYCSCCKHLAGKYKHKTYRFCPWCGAEMTEGENEID